jgi:REP element-mobilizing transposase RayT
MGGGEHSPGMARKLRVEYPGAVYHVMHRGDRREPISQNDADRQHFVATLGETCAKTGWQVQAYVLMPNHFHLVVETPQPNLVAGMKWFLGTYTSRFNRRHKLFGHLFSGRYKSLVVDGSGTGYLKSVCDYVHLNPGRAKLVAVEQPLKSFPWSSWPAYLGAPSKRPAWLRVDRLLGEYGIAKDSPTGRQRLEQALEERRGAEENQEFQAIRRGWCLGEETFRKELLGQMSDRMGAEHYGEERAETAATKAEGIIAEELKQRKWKATELQTRSKGDPAKVSLAARLRAETTMTAGWIAERLGMGSRGYLNHLLYRRRKSRDE